VSYSSKLPHDYTGKSFRNKKGKTVLADFYYTDNWSKDSLQ
jgi:hypothetical protein